MFVTYVEVRHVKREDKDMNNLADLKRRLKEKLLDDPQLIKDCNLRHLFETCLSSISANTLCQSDKDLTSKVLEFLDQLFSLHSKTAVSRLLIALEQLHFNAVAGEC